MPISRRRFAQLAVGGVLGLAAPAGAGLTARQRRAAESHRYFGGFRVGLQSGVLPGTTLDQLIEAAKANGIRYLELSPEHVDLRKEATPAIRASRAKLLDAGISIVAYGVVRVRDKREREDAERIFGHAQELGVPALVVDPSREFIKELEHHARHVGVAAAIMNRASGDFASAVQVLDAIKGRGEWLGACADTANFVSGGRDPAAEIRALGDAVLDVHLSDVTGAGQSCPPGNGNVDVPRVLETLKAARYDRGLIIAYQDAPDAPQALAGCVEYLRKLTGS